MKSKISVITPTLNRHDDLQQYVRTLVTQTLLPDELVIVDAGNLDTVEPMLIEELKDSKIELVLLKSEPGTSHQRNVGIDVASGDFYFFFDDDIILEPDYIEQSMKCFDSGPNPKIGGVMGTYNSPPRTQGYRTKYFQFFNMTHATDERPPVIMPSGASRWAIKPTEVIPIPVCCSCRVVFRAECFEGERWDCFLPGYTTSEDVEVSFRIAKNWQLVQTPDAVLFHKESPVSRNKYGERIARIIYSRYYFFRKHMPKDPAHVAAFSWYMFGTTALYSASAFRKYDENTVQTLRGIAKGYRLCISDIWS
jgi:glucosyl-dolichyl phosphate glucuronosyltransferase